MTPRLASGVLVGALIRCAQADGGFAALLARGDENSGAVLVILTERGSDPRILERIMLADGRYAWQSPNGQTISKTSEVPALIARKRRFDPDLWVLELDVPSAERFTAEMNSMT
jgi:hypothetical protein